MYCTLVCKGKPTAGYTLTVDVPPELYNQLQQRAAASARRVEDEVILALASALPDTNVLPDDLAGLLASFATLDDATLWRLAHSRVTEDDQARLSELADRRQREGLSADELREAEELVERHDRVMIIRAEAAVLLKERGRDVHSLLSEA
jgi:hypothetical protein